MLKSIIAEVEIKNDFLTIPEVIQERLSINKYSKIDFVVKREGIMIRVLNPPVITIEQKDPCFLDSKIKKQLTIIRNDFICQNPRCNKPILKRRGKKQYCCRKCQLNKDKSK